MRLPAEKMMPSFANLKDFGNTSSSTTWYSWAYIETIGDMQAGQTLFQVSAESCLHTGLVCAVTIACMTVLCVSGVWSLLDMTA